MTAKDMPGDGCRTLALATRAGKAILHEGGNTIEASVAIAAVLAVVYPHMTGPGGDSFWILSQPGNGIRALCDAGRCLVELGPGSFGSQACVPFQTLGPGQRSAWPEAL